jgi:hypothetical protein
MRKLTTKEFIERAKEIHGEKYDYSKVNYKNNRSKVTIICKKHGEFLQNSSNHLRGQSCPKCNIDSKKLTTEKFIEKAKEIHGDKYDYSKVNYKNNKTKVTIICKKHGEFLQTPNSHLRGQSCPGCSGSKKLTTEKFIERAKEIHGDKYDYSKVNYKNNCSKVTIICKKHGEFLQTPNSHLSGCGCLSCSGKEKLTTEKFIERAKEIHGDKYDYSKVNYKNNKTKVTIICKKHGEFLQKSSNHLRGYGCLDCYNDNKRLTTKEFIKRAKEIHGDRYDYSKVDYKNSYSKITIICPNHGEFLQTPSEHLRGSGCFNCGSNNKKLTTEEFIKRAKEIHGDRYDYSKVDYKNSYSKITVICKKHGEFLQTPREHLYNRCGCQRCNSSKLEELVNSILEKMNLSFSNYSKFEWLGKQNLDVYIQCLNLGIESQGIQHFIPIKHFGGEKKFKLTQKRDKTKLHLSEKNGIDIIYFVTPEMTQFSDIPEDFLKPGGYMGETIIQSEKELYNIIKNRCIEKGVNFVKISEYEVYRNPKFKII